MWRALWQAAPATEDDAAANAALLIGRVLMVIGLLPNGVRKIATFAQTAAGMGGEKQMIGGRPFPDQMPLLTFPVPEFFLGCSVLFDLAGALLIIVGAKTRAVSLFMAGYVLIAMAIFHSDIRNEMDLMHLIRNLPLLAGLMILSASGAGWWSIDGVAARRP